MSKSTPMRSVPLEALVIEQVPLGAIAPNDYNPNRQSREDFLLLIKSMRDDGFTQPVIVHQDKNPQGKFPIVDGEHRWTAQLVLAELEATGMLRDDEGVALDLDIDAVDTLRTQRMVLLEKHGARTLAAVKVNMTAAQMKAATLRHNRARGSEDVDLAAAVVRDLEKLGAIDWAKDALSMSDREVEILLGDLTAASALAGEDWTESWNPEKTTDDKTLSHVAHSLTPAAVAAIEAGNEAIASAPTVEERENAIYAQQVSIFRMTLVFDGPDEVPLVRAALGQRPAQTVLEWCQAAAAAASA